MGTAMRQHADRWDIAANKIERVARLQPAGARDLVAWHRCHQNRRF